MNCETCKFWHEWEEQPRSGIQLGDCRRHAPVLMEGRDKLLTKFPSTKSDDWCGSFKPKSPGKQQ